MLLNRAYFKDSDEGEDEEGEDRSSRSNSFSVDEEDKRKVGIQ